MDIEIAFVHGGGQGGWVWGETIAALNLQSGGCRTVALDAPGCGTKRGRVTAEVSLDDVAEEMIADIIAAGLKRPLLVGHSQGGQVMSLMLARRPDLFRRAVYVSCSIPLPGRSVRALMGSGIQGTNPDEVGWPFDPKTENPADRYPQMFCNDMDEAQRSTFLANLGADTWPLSTYEYTSWRYDHHGIVPATYVVCLVDGILPVRWQERFAERFAADRIVRIDAGHQAMNTRPHGLAEILRQEMVASH
ncbi:pimeloyl-ACP methyl ester carboxylesterase [Novosphingobium sp. PhB165]|uniref:alpha/beta fold hydrolase n=1 Tax=Novosphingobium sp. PhB165 TaxID=2485105 RepID=UPI00104D48A9|nr:alpha/beta hydrolase [Novosphingobium sp. PhB165]TCM20730.1 pimeloyl-ACP methyl ester carboxylesterase [Novosphingobium sp. PhB165]